MDILLRTGGSDFLSGQGGGDLVIGFDGTYSDTGESGRSAINGFATEFDILQFESPNFHISGLSVSYDGDDNAILELSGYTANLKGVTAIDVFGRAETLLGIYSDQLGIPRIPNLPF